MSGAAPGITTQPRLTAKHDGLPRNSWTSSRPDTKATQPSRLACALKKDVSHRATAASDLTRDLERGHARDEASVEPLVSPFNMIMLDEFRQCAPGNVERRSHCPLNKYI